jgi:hypothetical protein
VNSHLLPPGADGRGGGCPRRPATLERRGGATPSRRPGAKGPVPDFLWPSRLSRVWWQGKVKGGSRWACMGRINGPFGRRVYSRVGLLERGYSWTVVTTLMESTFSTRSFSTRWR